MSYSIVNSTILQKDAAESAAEIHGIACAMLCLDINVEASDWMSEALAKEADLFEEEKLTLMNLFSATKALMLSYDFEFDLFLPEDDEGLAARCFAITQWCLGFLFGLARIQTNTPWSDEITEILHDITEFTKLDSEVDNEDDPEELENGLMEIREYLRAAVMLISTELNGGKLNRAEVPL